jgi:dienelactone hydrolase
MLAMPGAPLETDTLILIGDDDDWTPAARCARWRDVVQTNGHVLRMTIYPGARHGFDSPVRRMSMPAMMSDRTRRRWPTRW